MSLTDLLSVESRIGYDLNGDSKAGDPITQIVKPGVVPVSPNGAASGTPGYPSLVKTASGAYAFDPSAIGKVGDAIGLLVLKTPTGTNWSPTSGSTISGIYNIAPTDATKPWTGQTVVVEMTGTGATATYKTWTFGQTSQDALPAAKAASATTVSLTDLLSVESGIGYDLNGDGNVGNRPPLPNNAATLLFDPVASAAAQLNGSYEQIADTGLKTVNANSISQTINLTAGGFYTIAMISQEGYGAVSLSIINPSGVQTGNATVLNQGNNYTQTFTATTSGLYTLSLSSPAVSGVAGSIISYDLTVSQALSKLPNISSTAPTGNSGDPSVNALLGGTWWHNPGVIPTTDPNLIIHGVLPSSASGNGPSQGLAGLSAASSRHTLTYSFLTSAPSGSDGNGFKAMTAEQKVATKSALDYISSLISIIFIEGTKPGQSDINFGTNNQKAANSAGYANPPYQGGGHPSYLMLANDQSTNNDLSKGTYGWETLLHEIGHTLGLKHPGNYNAGGGGSSGPYLNSATDNIRYTIMSYNDTDDSSIAVKGSGNNYSQVSLNPTTYMLYDIETLQYIYGANTNANSTSQLFSFGPTYQGYQTIWSPNGGTIDASEETYSNIIDLNAGNYSSIGIQGVSQNIKDTNTPDIINFWTYDGLNNVAISYGSIINVAKGGSKDDVFYLDMNNSDIIYGGAGNDTAYLYVKPGHTILQDYTRIAGSDNNGNYIEYKSTSSLGATLNEKLYEVENVCAYYLPLQIHQISELTVKNSSPASLAQTVSTFIQSTASLVNTSSMVMAGGDMPVKEQSIYILSNPI